VAKRVAHDEDDEQAALFEWAAWYCKSSPAVALLFAVPNGGVRNAREAVRLKRQGVMAGVPDIILPVASGGYGGLAIEMKRRDGKRHDVGRLQYDWIGGMLGRGWYATVAFGCDEAIAEIIGYLRPAGGVAGRSPE